MEVASALAARGLAVTLLELSGALWAGTMGDALAGWAARRLRDADIDLRLESAAGGVGPRGVTLVDGEQLEAGIVLAGVGVTPRVELAGTAGIAVGDGVLVDAAGRTSETRVWAAGDVASVEGLRVEHWHAAREAGERVARSILGDPVPPVRAPWVFTEVTGVTVDVIGVADEVDDEIVFGVPSDDRFGTALLAGGRPVQVASVGGWADVDVLRSLLERGGTLDELRGSVSS